MARDFLSREPFESACSQTTPSCPQRSRDKSLVKCLPSAGDASVAPSETSRESAGWAAGRLFIGGQTRDAFVAYFEIAARANVCQPPRRHFCRPKYPDKRNGWAGALLTRSRRRSTRIGILFIFSPGVCFFRVGAKHVILSFVAHCQSRR
ncbi:hypothetical protein CDAR_407681 [Caerostris darwini]|uniref:Uncharacterized protein n=1 Tax=Caerostris darwini TaxID=1538125 RepID=A0AAV4Q4F6_9ARAC|nr:hypothetical protein CDAR_407681 [Caerostris darwini]